MLDNKIKKDCPIDGVSIGRKSDKSTWRIDFKPEATVQQRLDAQAIVDSFDVVVEQKKLDDKEAARVAALVENIDDKIRRIVIEELQKEKN